MPKLSTPFPGDKFRNKCYRLNCFRISTSMVAFLHTPKYRKGEYYFSQWVPLTRKVGVKFYGFIFWLKRIILGKLGIKNVLPIMRNHYRLAALLHDVFRKPHRQKVYLKPKYKAKTSRFLSTLRFLFGKAERFRCTNHAPYFSHFRHFQEIGHNTFNISLFSYNRQVSILS